MNALSGILSWVWSIGLFIVGLGLVVFVHELGHFLVAKWSGIKVEEFALGFGRRLWARQRGDTEYRMNILPLGGYVKMLGQDDFNPAAQELGDPRSWQRATCGRRIAVLSAGVTMNIIFGALLFVLVYMIGIQFRAPIIGGVDKDMPAGKVMLPAHVAQAMGVEKAVGLQPGDRVLAMDGTKVHKFDQIMFSAVLSKPDASYRMTLERMVNGKPVEFEVFLTPEKMQSDEGDRYAFGVEPAADMRIEDPSEFGYAGEARFKKGDRIVGLAKIDTPNHWDFKAALKSLSGEQADVQVQRGSERLAVPVRSYLVSKPSKDKKANDLLSILGLSPRVKVMSVIAGTSAAEAGLKAGDVILAYGDILHPGFSDVQTINKEMRDRQVRMLLLRGGEQKEVTVTPGKRGVGFVPQVDQEHLVVAKVAPDSPAAKAGLVSGAEIVQVNGKAVANWIGLYDAVKAAAGQPLKLGYRVGQNDRIAEVDLGVLAKGDFVVEQFTWALPALEFSLIPPLMTAPVRGNPIEALSWSARDTLQFVGITYSTLRGLFQGRVSVKSTAGPVGIGAIAVQVAKQDMVSFVYFMAMLSVFLAVFNFLPLPVVDGGWVVMVLIEKLRGKPVPLKAQIAVTIAGWVMLMGIFLAVTFNDIMRILKG